MSTKKIIEIALAEVGYSENPPNSNKTKYGDWFGFDGQPWCAMFVSWVYHHAGYPLGNIGFLKGFAGCQTAVAYFKKEKMITDRPQEGDIVFFDWNGDGRYDHVGIFVKWIDYNHRFETIEGNTSLNNQSNGGMVMERKRNKTNALFVHPKVLGVAEATDKQEDLVVEIKRRHLIELYDFAYEQAVKTNTVDRLHEIDDKLNSC